MFGLGKRKAYGNGVAQHVVAAHGVDLQDPRFRSALVFENYVEAGWRTKLSEAECACAVSDAYIDGLIQLKEYAAAQALSRRLYVSTQADFRAGRVGMNCVANVVAKYQALPAIIASVSGTAT